MVEVYLIRDIKSGKFYNSDRDYRREVWHKQLVDGKWYGSREDAMAALDGILDNCIVVSDEGGDLEEWEFKRCLEIISFYVREACKKYHIY